MVEASLTPIEERILIVLYESEDHCLLGDEISSRAEVSMSTVSYEQKRLFALGLLQKRVCRFMEEDRISRRIIYELTMKGELIAVHLEHVASMLGGRGVSCLDESVVVKKHGGRRSSPPVVGWKDKPFR